MFSLAYPEIFLQHYCSFHILIKCSLASLKFSTSDETSEVKFINDVALESIEWSRDRMVKAPCYLETKF